MTKTPPWVIEADRYLGIKEFPGAAHNPTIINWLVKLNAWWRDDETPWCGVAMGAWMKGAGVTPPKAYYRAKAWADWGHKLAVPVYGCVVVFSRKGGGHVGIVVGEDERGRLMVLGGNQGNAVTIAPFDRSRVSAYRWPPGHEMWLQALPQIRTAEQSSTNEA